MGEWAALGERRSMVAARSLLAVPASNRKMVEKALASEADAVFLDLEDAVAPDRKAGARSDVVRAVKELDWRRRPKLYRINATDTRWFYRDVIEVAEAAGAALDAIMVPKVSRQEDLHAIALLLSGVEREKGLEPGKIRLEAQIESAPGLTNIDAIVRSTDRLGALHFGPGDFAASLGMPQTSLGTRDAWDESYPGHRFGYVMQRLVVAARAVGVRAVDGPVADHRDEEGLEAACRAARSLGYDGKWCIHPAQIPTVNRVFSPTEEEVAWAKRVMDAHKEAGAAGAGAVSVEGQMVDEASIRMARNTLDLAAER